MVPSDLNSTMPKQWLVSVAKVRIVHYCTELLLLLLNFFSCCTGKDDSSVSDCSDDESIATQPPTIVTPPTNISVNANKQYDLVPVATPRSMLNGAHHHGQFTWAPKLVAFEHRNDDMDRCITILFSLQHGDPSKDEGSGVKIAVNEQGTELLVSEKWDEYMVDVRLFYHNFPKDDNETEDEYQKHRYAMLEHVEAMKNDNMDGPLRSEFRYMLPFKVDPLKRRVTVTNTIRGRIAHVDLKENMKQKKQISERVIDLTEMASVADTVATGKRAKKPNQHPDFKY